MAVPRPRSVTPCSPRSCVPTPARDSSCRAYLRFRVSALPRGCAASAMTPESRFLGVSNSFRGNPPLMNKTMLEFRSHFGSSRGGRARSVPVPQRRTPLLLIYTINIYY